MKNIALAILACCAFGAQAASNVGTIDSVVGSVSVGGQGFVAQAKNGMPLTEGSTILVASKGKATVTLANGCTVSLLGGQHYTVNSKLNCEQAIASVKSLAATTQLAQAPIGTGVGGAGGAGAAGGGLFGLGTMATAGLIGGAIVIGGVSSTSSDSASGS